jgi:hypothetical protein
MSPSNRDQLAVIVERFRDNARAELSYRWTEWPLDPSRLPVHEVVGALLARQVSLAVNIASAPSIWNPHAAPVLLRAMTDVVISLGWILKSPDERAEKFILYGLGQLKLENERRKADLDPTNPDADEKRIIETNEAWISQQRYSFLTEVNLGAWSERNTRKMAEEAELLDFYNYAYQPFSAATHSTWHHVGRFNVKYCFNPLHRHHRVPADPDIPIDSIFLYLAGKYLDRAFEVFDTNTGVAPPEESAFDVLITDMNELGASGEPQPSAPRDERDTPEGTAEEGEA